MDDARQDGFPTLQAFLSANCGAFLHSANAAFREPVAFLTVFLEDAPDLCPQAVGFARVWVRVWFGMTCDAARQVLARLGTPERLRTPGGTPPAPKKTRREVEGAGALVASELFVD